jgi:hypothetical protein
VNANVSNNLNYPQIIVHQKEIISKFTHIRVWNLWEDYRVTPDVKCITVPLRLHKNIN